MRTRTMSPRRHRNVGIVRLLALMLLLAAIVAPSLALVSQPAAAQDKIIVGLITKTEIESILRQDAGRRRKKPPTPRASS